MTQEQETAIKNVETLLLSSFDVYGDMVKSILSTGKTIQKAIEELKTNRQLQLDLNIAEVKLVEMPDIISDLNVESLIPTKATSGSAAFDIKSIHTHVLTPNETLMFKTGFLIEVPEGYELNVYSRSGLSLIGITVANQPGIIDSDYRGEFNVILHNKTTENYVVNAGDKIAQCSLKEVVPTTFKIVTELSKTKRGAGGFGHTGR